MNAYSRTYQIRFSDIDANRHVNNAAYIDAAGDMRYDFLKANGKKAVSMDMEGMLLDLAPANPSSPTRNFCKSSS